MNENEEETVIHRNYYNEILNVLKKDQYAEHLRIQIIDFTAGAATVRLKAQDYMLNAHGTVHGGILYTLADFAFALASNSYGKTAVGLSTNTHFMKSAQVDDTITAKAEEVRRNHKISFYQIAIETDNEIIGSVEAVAYRKSRYFITMDKA